MTSDILELINRKQKQILLNRVNRFYKICSTDKAYSLEFTQGVQAVMELLSGTKDLEIYFSNKDGIWSVRYLDDAATG